MIFRLEVRLNTRNMTLPRNRNFHGVKNGTPHMGRPVRCPLGVAQGTPKLIQIDVKFSKIDPNRYKIFQKSHSSFWLVILTPFDFYIPAWYLPAHMRCAIFNPHMRGNVIHTSSIYPCSYPFIHTSIHPHIHIRSFEWVAHLSFVWAWFARRAARA